jgi:hypothetical protein
MSRRAQQGLGLVVTALLLWLVAVAIPADAPIVLDAGLSLAVILLGIVGLALLAWGLLRG